MTDRTIVSGPPGSATFATVGSELIVDSTWGASRVRLMPSEYNAPAFQGGFFRVGRALAGITGVAAAGPLVSFRWGLPNSEALIKRVSIGAAITTAFTAAQPVDFDLIIARGFTVADTGGNPVTPILGNSQKNRTRWMNTSQLADLRDSSGAALTAGTRTLDAAAIGEAIITQTNGLGSGGMSPIDLYKHDIMAGHPLMIGNNEGLIIRVVTAMGAVGVVKVYYSIEWAEVPGL